MTEQAHEALRWVLAAEHYAWSDDLVQTWVEAFMLQTGPFVAEAMNGACKRIAMDRPGRFSLADVIDQFRHAQADLVRKRALPRPPGAQCDGSGWNPEPQGMMPCRRCNPALASVYSDPDKLRRWSNGASLASLDVGVERNRNGSVQYADGYRPPRCETAWEYEAPVVPINRGFDIARRAYEATCREQDREPNTAFFREKLNAFIGVDPGLVGPDVQRVADSATQNGRADGDDDDF